MTSTLLSVATFASPLGRLLEASFDLDILKGQGKEIGALSLMVILEAVTITAIAYTVAETAETSKSVAKATIVGLINYLLSVVAARLLVAPTISRLCKPCSSFGRFGVGAVVLAALAITLAVVVSVLKL